MTEEQISTSPSAAVIWLLNREQWFPVAAGSGRKEMFYEPDSIEKKKKLWFLQHDDLESHKKYL